MATRQAGPAPSGPGSTPNPTEATRIRGFAMFFQSYMSVATILLAALPIPVTQLHLIPTFEGQRGILSVYSSLFCFLLFSFLFFWRHSFARWMFPLTNQGRNRVISRMVPILPLVFIALTIICIILYHSMLTDAVHSIKVEFTNVAPKYIDTKAPLDSDKFSVLPDGKITFTPEFIIKHLDADKIPHRIMLLLSYIGIFVFSELAFTVMVLKEYLQDILRLDDLTLIANRDIALGTVGKTDEAAR